LHDLFHRGARFGCRRWPVVIVLQKAAANAVNNGNALSVIGQLQSLVDATLNCGLELRESSYWEAGLFCSETNATRASSARAVQQMDEHVSDSVVAEQPQGKRMRRLLFE
jgi:hypothetical protein